MSVLPDLASLPIIGHPTSNALPQLAELASLRAPAFLPDSLNSFLFETHWMYWAAAAALSLILLHLGRSRANRPLTRAGLGVLLLTLAWIAAAWLFVTPKERLYDAHQALAQAAKEGDVDKILSYFSDHFQCTALGITVPAEAHDQIATRLKSYGIKANHITAYTSEISGPTATTRLTIITESDLGPVKTTWRLTWEDLPRDDWKIELAELLKIGDNPTSEATFLPQKAPSF